MEGPMMIGVQVRGRNLRFQITRKIAGLTLP